MERFSSALAVLMVFVIFLSSGCGGGEQPGPDAGTPVEDSGTSLPPPPTCVDGKKNGDETGIDCGGACDKCDAGSGCATDGDCTSGFCGEGVCAVPTCDDGAKNGNEADVDCGGSCPDCAEGKSCNAPFDCTTGVCQALKCAPASCEDGVKNGDETDVNCGGSCEPCFQGRACIVGDDCSSGICSAGICSVPSCTDGVKNASETDIDCGGTCGRCGDGLACNLRVDCVSKVCADGVCQAPTCSDSERNGTESDVDCGGSCAACADGVSCGSGSDCASGSCKFGKCQAPTCSDGAFNGQETALDCGGPSCGPCSAGLACAQDADCKSSICDNGSCAQPTCSDGVKNQNETDLDCGGVCGPCVLGQACTLNHDCQSGKCLGVTCVTALPSGLYGEYFSNYTELVTSRIDPQIDFSWPTGEPAPGVGADDFSVRWTGFLEVPTSATYTFITRADDCARMWVNGQRIIDDWKGHAAVRTEGTISLTGGTRAAIKVEYCDIRFGGVMQLFWRTPSMAEQLVPSSVLVNDGTPSGTPGPLGPYRNPTLGQNCADASVIAVPGKYYLACAGGAFPLYESNSLVKWTATTSSLLDSTAPTAPWALDATENRSPELHAFGSDFVAYYTAKNADGTLAIGAGTASIITGPYTHQPTPLVTDPLGVSDPTVFTDGATRYLLYVVGGSQIYLRELAANGLGFAAGSTPSLLLQAGASNWEGGLIGAPWMVQRNGDYVLFYGGNSASGPAYRTGVAKASAITGPYAKHGAAILDNNTTWLGPGHGSVISVGSVDYFVYSGWQATSTGTPDTAKGRQLLLDRVQWTASGWPTISDGTPSTEWMAPPGNE